MVTKSHPQQCPVCQQHEFEERFIKKGKHFWRCTTCGLERIYPLPTLEELEAYYDSSYDSGMYKDFVAAEDMKHLTAQQRLKEISKYCAPGRWLDIGCSNGIFVENAITNGFEAEGIDLSKVAVEHGKGKGLPLHTSTIEDWKPEYLYDTIVAFDVLEHVLDPTMFINCIHRLLDTNGTIVLSLPNLQSLPSRIMGKNWYFYIPEEHLHYFNPQTIGQLLQHAGFDVLAINRTYKPLTLNYSLIQFEEYNPLIFNILNTVSKIIPGKLKDISIPLYIGEMIAIARKK